MGRLCCISFRQPLGMILTSQQHVQAEVAWSRGLDDAQAAPASHQTSPNPQITPTDSAIFQGGGRLESGAG